LVISQKLLIFAPSLNLKMISMRTKGNNVNNKKEGKMTNGKYLNPKADLTFQVFESKG